MHAPFEEVTIPFIWETPSSSCRLVRWLVRDGDHVCTGESIYELEVDGTICEVESFFTGYMKQLVRDDRACRVGDHIATIVLDEMSTRYRVLPIYLSGGELALLDSIRGDFPREAFAREVFLKAISRIASGYGAGETTG